MKREIKCRAFDTKYGKMYYSHGDNPRVNCFHGSWEIDLEGDNGDTVGTVECDDKTYPLMQYTGLKDKNGVEIYEGDIIDFIFWMYHEHESETHYIGKIDIDETLQASTFIFHQDGNSCFYALYELTFDSESDIEVIGNIYENPELLKK